jgi:uncharacterized protein YndB with AHSA1/START domain
MKTETITISAIVCAPVEKVWEFLTSPKHITKWNFASDDWECPWAENDLCENGKFKVRMQAKDESAGFDFEGQYTKIVPHKLIEYVMSDGRKVKVEFHKLGEKTKVIETFDPENENPREMQRAGWQTIIDNFRKYAEVN